MHVEKIETNQMNCTMGIQFVIFFMLIGQKYINVISIKCIKFCFIFHLHNFHIHFHKIQNTLVILLLLYGNGLGIPLLIFGE